MIVFSIEYNVFHTLHAQCTMHTNIAIAMDFSSEVRKLALFRVNVIQNASHNSINTVNSHKVKCQKDLCNNTQVIYRE